jgi:hypothetical protein
MELAPGAEDAHKLIKECAKPALETLSRVALKP